MASTLCVETFEPSVLLSAETARPHDLRGPYRTIALVVPVPLGEACGNATSRHCRSVRRPQPRWLGLSPARAGRCRTLWPHAPPTARIRKPSKTPLTRLSELGRPGGELWDWERAKSESVLPCARRGRCRLTGLPVFRISLPRPGMERFSCSVRRGSLPPLTGDGIAISAIT
jgi:hypothetical protein